MRHYYFKLFLNAIVYSVLLFANNQLRAQTPSTMEFGSSTVVLGSGTNPSVDQSTNALLNSFDMSAQSSASIFLAFATSGNSVGTDAIGGASDAVLSWAGNGSASVISGTLSTDSGGEIGITSMQFAYQQSIGGSTLGFTFTGKKDGVTVGTLILVTPTHNSAISINLTSPTTGSFSDIDELIITPDTPLFGGFSIDDMVVISAISNTAPVIGGTSAGQSVNDNSTISPFSSITTTDADGDNLSATITLDNNAKGLLTGTGLSGTGPYTIASTTPADLQTKLRALSFNPTDNRTATSETTTFTVVINDGTTDDTDNTTTVISNAVGPTVSSVSVPANATYVTGENLDFTVNFDENVTVNTTGGIPQIAITIGATTRQATYISGSGTSSLVFRHTILTGDLDTDGIAVGSFAANGSTLKDTGGKDANLTLNSVGSTASVLVDAVSPTVTSVSVPINSNYLTGQNLDFTVNFDENITVNTTGGTPQIAITIGATTHQAAYQSGSGTNALVFRYTVQSGDSDTDGIAVGTLAANGGTLKDAASNDAVLTLNSVGSTTNVLVGIETVTWTGSMNNDWNTASNWSPSVTPPTNADVVIPSGVTNYPTISSPITVNSITINSGASLIATSSVTASVTYKRNIADTNWHLFGPAVSGETLEDIIANHTFASGSGSNLGIGSYDNNGASPWSYATPILTGSTIPGYGFSIKLAAPGDVSITGNLVTTNYGVPIGTGTRTNYNLLGNPYTNYINSATLAGSNPVINNATFWLWDGTKYITHNNANPIEIAPSQGFFVEANSNSNVIFFTSNQSHQGSDTFMKQEPKTNFELQVSNGENSYSTSVFYIEGKSTGFDYGYDSKMFSGVDHNFSVFTQLITENEGENLAIQTLPKDNTSAIPVGITAKAGSKLTFSIKKLQLPDGLNIYLEDKNTGEFTNLSEENYTATLNKDSNGIGQFYLYKDSKKPTSIIEPSLDNISIYSSSNNEITITGLQTEANIAVYSILGKEIINRNIISNGVSKVSIPSVAAGVYIVKLNSNLGEVSKKVILK